MPGAGGSPSLPPRLSLHQSHLADPDHSNGAPKICTEPHLPPFLTRGSAAAPTLYTKAALSTQTQHFPRGTESEHPIDPACAGVFRTEIWERCGEEEGGLLLWLFPSSCLWLVLPCRVPGSAGSRVLPAAAFPTLGHTPLNLAT